MVLHTMDFHGIRLNQINVCGRSLYRVITGLAGLRLGYSFSE